MSGVSPNLFSFKTNDITKKTELGGEWGKAFRSTIKASSHRQYLNALKENDEFAQLTPENKNKILNAAKETIHTIKVENGYTPPETYLKVIENTPIVSIDLIIFNHKGEVLLGKRSNEPGKNTFFVPGARLRKNEETKNAIERIADEELGIFLNKNAFNLLGAFNHLYSNNFANDSFSTHYICFAYSVVLKHQFTINPDDQHAEFCWMDPIELTKNPMVHSNVKNYFHPAPWNKIT